MYVLSPSEAELLLYIIGNEEQPMYAVQEQFQQRFSRHEQFRACCAAFILLKEQKGLKLSHRLNAWYLIFATYHKSTPEQNPFAALNIQADEDANIIEKCFVSDLSSAHNFVQIQDLSAQEYIAKCDKKASKKAFELQSQEPLSRPKQYEEQDDFAASSIFTNVLDPVETELPGSAEMGVWLQCQASTLTTTGFEPPWCRPKPPLMTPLASELHWFHPDITSAFIWDTGIADDTLKVQTVKRLIQKAFRGPLLPSQQQEVLNALEADPKLVYYMDIAPEQFPLLVEHTPTIAFEVLVKLIKSNQVLEFFSVLAKTEMSLHSMEVVNRLTTAVELPTEFIHLYITNCINSCESTQDKYVQNRLVRLVCVFLQSLIRNKIINIQDLLHEVQAFCVNFSRIREAAKLFRLLKQLESGPRQGDNSPTPSVSESFANPGSFEEGETTGSQASE